MLFGQRGDARHRPARLFGRNRPAGAAVEGNPHGTRDRQASLIRHAGDIEVQRSPQQAGIDFRQLPFDFGADPDGQRLALPVQGEAARPTVRQQGEH
jgi:hypothetical protein